MDALFYAENRKAFVEHMVPGEAAVFLSGELLRKSADDDYAFYANRNFVYLTGIEQRDTVLILYKEDCGFQEKLFILPPDALAERWSGARLKAEEAARRSGIKEIMYYDEWQPVLAQMIQKRNIQTVYLDMDHKPGRRNWNGADWMKQYIETGYPQMEINVNNFMSCHRLALIRCHKTTRFLVTDSIV